MSTSSTAATLSLALVLALAAGGCPADDGDGDGGPVYNCEAEMRDEQFLAGMIKVGAGGTQVVLTSAAPTPPGRDDNTWLIDVSRADAPVSGATIKVTPFMPDHQHGTSVPVVVTPVAETPGRYQLAPINLWMPGLWEITIEVTPAGGTRDSVQFKFCITG